MIINALIRTEGKARMNICTACFRNTYQSELNELSKMSGGRKIKRMPLGSILLVASIESPIIPRLSENLPMRMLTMNRVGVKGMNLNTFCRLLIMIATVREKKRKKRTSASVVMYPLIMFD